VSLNSHTGKSGKQKQSYFESINKRTNNATNEYDNELKPSLLGSDVSLASQAEIEKKPALRKKPKGYGLSGHMKKHMSVYIVTIITIASGLYLALGLPSYGNIQRITEQIDYQKELNNTIKEDLAQLENTVANSNKDTQSKFEEINLKLQEQYLKLQFLDQFVKESR
jgi:hypothetical protein